MFIFLFSAINSVAQGNAGGMIMTNSNLSSLSGGAMTGGGLVVNNLKQSSMPPGQMMGGMGNQGQNPNLMMHPGNMQNGPMVNPNRMAQMQLGQQGHMGPRVAGSHILVTPRMQGPPNMQLGKCFSIYIHKQRILILLIPNIELFEIKFYS